MEANVENPNRHSPASSSETVLASCLGKTISMIRHNRYFYNSEADDSDVGALEVSFDDLTHILLDLNSDGETSRVTNEKLGRQIEFNHEGSHFQWQEHCLTNESEWSGIVGSILDHTEAMIERIEGVGFFVIGWRLTFSNGQTMIYYNCGDDARILLAPPLRIISSLEVDFVTIFQKTNDWRGFLDVVKDTEVPDSFLSVAERKQGSELRDPFAKF